MELVVNKPEKPPIYTNWKRCRVVCYYVSSDRPSIRYFGEYSLSGIIVTALNFFTTPILHIDRIEIYEQPEAGGKLLHTEWIPRPAGSLEAIEEFLAIASYNRIRKEPALIPRWRKKGMIKKNRVFLTKNPV